MLQWRLQRSMHSRTVSSCCCCCCCFFCCCFCCVFCFFFFSSRRRHTRLVRDWSSDVCSSDLPDSVCEHLLADFPKMRSPLLLLPSTNSMRFTVGREETSVPAPRIPKPNMRIFITWYRSEERRVGKECRSRWSPYH